MCIYKYRPWVIRISTIFYLFASKKAHTYFIKPILVNSTEGCASGFV